MSSKFDIISYFGENLFFDIQNLEKSLNEQKERMTMLENTVETLTRELNDKKQVLQREMSSFENQSKVL